MPKPLKRTSLDALELVGTPASAPEEPGVSTEESGSSTRENKARETKARKRQSLYLPVAVHEQLRQLAFEEQCKMHSLVMEGLDLLFRSRGAKSIEELTQ